MSRPLPEGTVWLAADVLAYLERRVANARRVAKANAMQAERAAIVRQDCEVILGDLLAGMHIGQAEVAAALQPEEP